MGQETKELIILNGYKGLVGRRRIKHLAGPGGDGDTTLSNILCKINVRMRLKFFSPPLVYLYKTKF